MPNPTASSRPAVQAALVGALCLASGMGIGRFAFTPLLPLMQDAGLSLPHGAWLASINYASVCSSSNTLMHGSSPRRMRANALFLS